jgi:hypothetical protein
MKIQYRIYELSSSLNDRCNAKYLSLGHHLTSRNLPCNIEEVHDTQEDALKEIERFASELRGSELIILPIIKIAYECQ